MKKRMTQVRLDKIVKALGWDEKLHAEGPFALSIRTLALRIANGWTALGLEWACVCLVKSSVAVNLRISGGSMGIKAETVEAAIIAAAIEWADAGCPGGKS